MTWEVDTNGASRLHSEARSKADTAPFPGVWVAIALGAFMEDSSLASDGWIERMVVAVSIATS